jgi:serine/threonine-protein kinase
MSETIPDRIGRYEILGRIGAGGMGVLYRALDPGIGREVAIKQLKSSDDALLERFEKEARAAGRLNHPNIVTVYDVGLDKSGPFIAMEFVPGKTLAQLIKTRVELPLDRRLALMTQLCDGLSYAHDAGIVHRDIKPANLMVHDQSRQLKILDFGIARMTDSTATRGGTPGTPSYMSPEQIQGTVLDRRSDIFAVGLVLYELLCWRRAFAGDDTMVILQQVLHGSPVPLDEIDPSIAPDLIEAVEKSIQKQPERRYQHLNALRNVLVRVADQIEANSSDLGTTPNLTETVPLPPAPTPASDHREKLLRRREVQLQEHLSAATGALSDGDVDAAQEAAEQAAMLDPDNAQVVSIFSQVSQRRQEQQVATWLSEAEQHLKSGDLDEARAAVQRALGEQPRSRQALQLKRQIQRAELAVRREQERAEAASDALSRAQQSFDAEEYEGVLRAVAEIPAERPEHEEAASLRQRALEQIERIERRVAQERRARSTAQQARMLARRGDLEAALELLRGYQPILPVIQEVLRDLEAEETRKRDFARLVDQARGLLQQGKLDEATKAIDEALSIDPLDDAATAMQASIEEAVGERERAQREEETRRRYLDAQLERVKGTLAEDRPEAARETLRALQEDGFDDPAVDDLLRQAEARSVALEEQEAERDKEAREIEEALERARRQLAAGELAEARAAVQEVLNRDLEHDEATQLLGEIDSVEAHVQAAREIAATLERGRRQLSAGAIAEARDAAREALARVPDHREASQLVAEVDRAEAQAQRARELAAALERGRERLAVGAFAEARAIIERFPDHADAQALERKIEEAERVDRRRRAERLVIEARAAVDRRQFADALESLDEAVRIDNEVPGLQELRQVGEDGRDRAAELEKTLALGEQGFERGDLDAATVQLRVATDLDSSDPRTIDLRTRVDEARAAEQSRQERIASTLQRARSAVEKAQLEEAVALLTELQRDESNVEGLRELLADAEQRLQQAREAERREAQLSALIARAAGDLETGKLKQALRRVDEALALKPESAEAADFKARIEQALREERERTEQEEREQAIGKWLQRARHARTTKGAIKWARKVLTLDPANQEARGLLKARLESQAVQPTVATWIEQLTWRQLALPMGGLGVVAAIAVGVSVLPEDIPEGAFPPAVSIPVSIDATPWAFVRVVSPSGDLIAEGRTPLVVSVPEDSDYTVEFRAEAESPTPTRVVAISPEERQPNAYNVDMPDFDVNAVLDEILGGR